MADEVDQTADRIENEVSFTVGELCRKAAAIPAGRPGECDFCGEQLREHVLRKLPLPPMKTAIAQGPVDVNVRGRILEMTMEWQSIETAPKDGTRLLLATPTGKVADGMWSTRYEVWSWPYVMAEPTHWMPAPPIPTMDMGGGCSEKDNVACA